MCNLTGPLTKEKKFCMVCAMKDIHNKAIDGNYEYQVPLQLVKNLRRSFLSATLVLILSHC
jgi:hypothetical protein